MNEYTRKLLLELSAPLEPESRYIITFDGHIAQHIGNPEQMKALAEYGNSFATIGEAEAALLEISTVFWNRKRGST